MKPTPEATGAYETIFTRTTAGFFLREFCFSSTRFKPPSEKSEVELADFIIQLADLVMVFQLKEREEPSTDPDTERRWFERKVIKKGTQQIRDTIKYLKECPPEIANDRGRAIALPEGLDLSSVVKVVVFKGSVNLPDECSRHRFHDSQTAGFIHVISAEDWAGILNTLVTPREIADYLRTREDICRSHVAASRAVSEKALVGQFLREANTAAPASEFELDVDRLVNESSSFDLLRLLNLFPDRITLDAPAGTIVPDDMKNAGDGYYPIVLEIAKLPRTDLAAFKERFTIAWKRAGEYYDPPFMRMVSSTGVGFVFSPIPRGLEEHAQNGLVNFVSAHMYERRIHRCIGAAFVNEGEWRHISWILLDQEWEQNPDMERFLRENPLPPVQERFVPRYRLDER